jgi:hypothetical protein
VTRLLTEDGLVVGISYAPSLHDDERSLGYAPWRALAGEVAGRRLPDRVELCLFIGELVDLQRVAVGDGLGDVDPAGMAAPTAAAGSGDAAGVPPAGGTAGLGVTPAGFWLVESEGLGVVLSVGVELGVLLGVLLGLGLELGLGLGLRLGLGGEELVLGVAAGPVLAPFDGVQPGVC